MKPWEIYQTYIKKDNITIGKLLKKCVKMGALDEYTLYVIHNYVGSNTWDTAVIHPSNPEFIKELKYWWDFDKRPVEELRELHNSLYIAIAKYYMKEVDIQLNAINNESKETVYCIYERDSDGYVSDPHKISMFHAGKDLTKESYCTGCGHLIKIIDKE